METASSPATSLGGDKVSTDAALRDRPACCCCYRFAPSPGTGPCLTLGLWDQLATQHINKVWAPWDDQPSLGTTSKEVEPASPSLPPWSRFFFLGASLVFKTSWTFHKRKVLLASCQDTSSTLACECHWVPIGMHHHGGPLSVPPPASQSHGTPVRATRHTCLHLSAIPDSCFRVSKQCWSECEFPVLPHICRIQVTEATASEPGLFVCLFRQCLANQYFHRHFLDDSRVLCV